MFVISVQAYSQNWISVDYPGNMVWQAAELNGNLYIADGGLGLKKFDGSQWTTESNFNNSYNTAHKSKSSVKEINGILYVGADDFNTSGEGDIHTFDGDTFRLFQNSDFPYNGNYQIHDFAEYKGEIYVGGQFMSPDNGSANLAKWNGSDWVAVGTNSLNYFGNQSNIVNRLIPYKDKLFVLSSSKCLMYDGVSWDSLSLGMNFSGYYDGAIYKSELYLCGGIMISDGSGNVIKSGTVAKWDGTNLTIVAANESPYFAVHRLFADESYLYGIVQETYQGDIYLARYDGTSWSKYAFLQSGTGGVVPGYALGDYNALFKFNNELYIGGRFAQIGGQSIQSLAKLSAETSLIPAAPSGLTATPVNSILLNWQDNSDNEDGFFVESVQDTVIGTWEVVAELTANTTTFHHTGLTNGITYYYRVKAFNEAGTSDASALAYATEGATVLPEHSQQAGLSVYPNPVQDELIIAPLSGRTTLQILDVSGKVILNTETSQMQARLNMEGLVNGIYFVRIIGKGLTSTHRIAVNK